MPWYTGFGLGLGLGLGVCGLVNIPEKIKRKERLWGQDETAQQRDSNQPRIYRPESQPVTPLSTTARSLA